VSDDDHTVALFEYALTQLIVDDEGVAPSDIDDVTVCADLCLAVRHAIACGDAPDDLLPLVAATEDLLTTAVVISADNPAIVATWRNERRAAGKA
jgi:hypothetical protein